MRYFFACLTLFIGGNIFGQNDFDGKWRAEILRADGRVIPFTVNVAHAGLQPAIAVQNGKEQIFLKDFAVKGRDSVSMQMPVFESGFLFGIDHSGEMKGFWIRQLANREQRLPVVLRQGLPRYDRAAGGIVANVKGKWLMQFNNADGNTEPAILTLEQAGQALTGSILTETGDYRYLEGVVDADSARLSTFDGVHAVALAFALSKNNQTLNGLFWSGVSNLQTFTAEKKPNPVLPNTTQMYVKDKENPFLDFLFKDLDGKMVSIKDERFRNKVVIIDLMGSWCPNCMDETAFLSDFYRKNKSRGIEVIGLAYELTTDYDRSRKSLEKFRQQFDIQYPVLITGVSVSDTLRTEKTLPQLTKIKMFPSTIFLDRSGKVAKIETGFNGPATGEYYIQFQKEFDRTIEKLLQ